MKFQTNKIEYLLLPSRYERLPENIGRKGLKCVKEPWQKEVSAKLKLKPIVQILWKKIPEKQQYLVIAQMCQAAEEALSLLPEKMHVPKKENPEVN